MKQLVAIVKPFRAQAVLEAIGEVDIDTVLVHEAKGYGRQKEKLPRYVGGEYSRVYLPKIAITVLVSDEAEPAVIARIEEMARTGRIGDGKIFVLAPEIEIDF